MGGTGANSVFWLPCSESRARSRLRSNGPCQCIRRARFATRRMHSSQFTMGGSAPHPPEIDWRRSDSPSGRGGMGGTGSVARWPQANGRSATEAPHRKQSLAQRVSHTREASVEITA
jgi:hypothetical protein